MIFVGYQGIGKSSLNCKQFIDLESSNLWYVNDEGKKVRDPHWVQIYANFIQHLASLGYDVFVSSHKAVREELKKRNIQFCTIYPSLELKDEWLNKLYTRYMCTDKEKDYKAYMNAKEMYEENIADLANEELRIELDDIHYVLVDEIKDFLIRM